MKITIVSVKPFTVADCARYFLLFVVRVLAVAVEIVAYATMAVGVVLVATAFAVARLLR